MTVLNKHYLTGVAAGALSTSSVGPIDTAFSSISGGVLTVDNSGVRPPRIKVNKTAGSSVYAEDTFSARTAGALKIMWVPPAAAPSNSFSIITVRNGVNLCFKVNCLQSGPSMRIMDSNNVQAGGSTGGGSVAFDQTKRYRIEVKWNHTTGNIELKMFDGDTTTQVGSTVTVTGAAINTQHTRVLWGLENSTPEVGAYFMDDLVLSDTEAYLGPFVANVAPTVSLAANDDTPDIGQTITLTATASDPDGSIASYAFSQTAGPAVTLSGSGSTRTFVAPSVGGATTLTFQVVVTDNEGATTTATHSVVVNPPSNVVPTASLAASDTTPDAGQTVTLTATGTDTDGTIVSYAFSQTSGPTVTLSGSGNTRTFVAPYNPSDTALVFSATVTDNSGATSSPASRSVTVNKHPFWVFAPPDGAMHPILKQAPPPIIELAPVVLSLAVTPGDGYANVDWTIDPGDYNVTGIHFDKTPSPWSTELTAMTGTQRFGQLTNGTQYTIVGTPMINGVLDPSFAQTVLVTPTATAPLSKFRADGMYAGSYSYDTMLSTFGTKTIGGVISKKDVEVTSNYHQWGVAASDPANATNPGNPYPNGTWYRDFKDPTFSTFSLVKEKVEADRDIWKVLTFAANSSSAVKFIGQGRAANSTGYDWALAKVIDAWVLKAKTIYDYDPLRPLWVTINSEPEVSANQGVLPNIPGTPTSRITDNASAPQWQGAFFSKFFERMRVLAPGMKSCLWLGGFRSGDTYTNDMLTAMTVAPDLITGDPYVNDTNNHSATDNFNDFTDQFRLSTGKHRTQYVRLSNLARTGVAANSGIMIPLALTEHGISKKDKNNVIMHTDQEMADYISGAGTWESIREAMKSCDLEFVIYFDRDSGPQGQHRLDDGTHPLAVAAFRDELFRTDVTG